MKYPNNFIKLFFLTIISTCFFIKNSSAQDLQSTLENLSHAKDDSLKAILYADAAWYILEVNPDSSIYYANQSIAIAKKKNYVWALLESYNIKGMALRMLNKFDEAESSFNEGLSLAKKESNVAKLFSITNNIANLYNYKGDYSNAVITYKKAIVIAENNNMYDKKIIVISNLVGLYQLMGNLDKALSTAREGMELTKQQNDTIQEAYISSNIGLILLDKTEYEEAIKYFDNAEKTFKTIEDYSNLATVISNKGIAYRNMKAFEKALTSYNEALEIFKAIESRKGLAMTFQNIGLVYHNLKQYKKSLDFFQQSLSLAKEIEDNNLVISILNSASEALAAMQQYNTAEEYLNEASKMFSLIEEDNQLLVNHFKSWRILYEAQNKHKEALHFSDTIQIIEQRIINERNNINMSLFKVELDVSSKEKEIVNLNKINNLSAEIIAEQNKKRNILIVFLILTLLFTILIINRFVVVKKQKNIIFSQKQEVEKQKEILDIAHHTLTEKNKEITDSINYAKRIQEAILPSRYSLVENLNNGFILFKPKDIVSGDFYWLERYKETIYFAAADCTGHGVPGAMVSVMCSNALSKTLLEENITLPGKILDRTRELVVQRFSKSSEDVKDGMDVSFCSIKYNVESKKSQTTAILQWAGANNPLWIIRPTSNNLEHQTSNFELLEFKPNKQPIGKVDNPEPFTTHTINLQKGDTIYIFTDGFADQFGGEKGKKMMYKPFKELLLSIQEKTMDEQKEVLAQHFENWKGNLEQVDDVCIIGVRI